MNFFKAKTFKPTKAHKNNKRKTLSSFAQKTMATLGNSDGMRQAVMLPKGENLNEWLAVNTVDFFNEISLMYGTVVEDCTDAACPVMSAGDKFTYRWADGVKVKKPIECSAPKYIELLFEWVEDQINDESLFPLADDAEFPKNFRKNVAVIFKRYFRVYAHVYHSHIKKIQAIGAEAHLNTCFKHFIYFVLEFELVAAREMAPLAQLIERLTGKNDEKKKK